MDSMLLKRREQLGLQVAGEEEQVVEEEVKEQDGVLGAMGATVCRT